MSGRPGVSKRLSSHKFQPIPDTPLEGMPNPNDATIDIPLANIPSQGQTGARQANGGASPLNYQAPSGLPTPDPNENNEKAGLFQQGPGRRRRLSDTGKSLEDPRDGTLNRLGRIYTAILNFSVVTRYLIYVTPLALLIAVPIVIGATDIGKDANIGGVRIDWFFTWIEVVWLSLWGSKLIAHALPYIFQYLCGIVSSGTRKYALILQSLEIPLSIVGWCIVSLVTFLPVN